MKQATLCTALLLFAFGALPAQGQTPDTTSAWRYFPLEVGSVWEYERYEEQCYIDWPCDPEEFEGYLRRSVEGDSVVAERKYALVVEETFAPGGLPEQTSRQLVRFDTLTARLYARPPSGEEEPWPEFFTCPLDAPFDSDIRCDPVDNSPFYTEGGYEVDLMIAESAVTAAFKSYQGDFSYRAFVADIGEVWTNSGKFSTSRYTLTYVRVGEIEYGSERFPVAAEAAPPASALALSVFPNPSSGDATARLSLDAPQRVRLAILDVLGRRVLSADLGAQPAGEVLHRLGAAGLPAGVYFVRFTGDAGTTTTTQFVRH